MCKGGTCVSMGQHDALHTEALARGLFVGLNIKMKIFRGGCCQARSSQEWLPESDFADSKNVSIFTFPHCGPLCMCENNFSSHQLEVWL